MQEMALFPAELPDLSLLYDQSTTGFDPSPVIFGCGQLGRRVADRLSQRGITPIAFTDNNEKLWGQMVQGIPVLPPAEAIRAYGESHPMILAIATAGFHAFENEMTARGVRLVVPYHQFAWKFPDTFLPYYFLNTQENWVRNRPCIEAVWQLLGDDISRLEFARQSMWRCTGDDRLIRDHTTGLQYFRADLFELPENPVLVDCGAFDGDTLRDWIDFRGTRFEKAIAFEPDPENYQRLQQTIAGFGEELSRRMTVLNHATGSKSEIVGFDTGRGIGSSLSDAGEFKVQVVTLDEILADQRISMIKMDIEGAEFETLVGARQIIQRQRPVLSICIYHHQNDLWRIPLLMASITTGYRFYIRRHTGTWFETVLYAIPEEMAVK